MTKCRIVLIVMVACLAPICPQIVAQTSIQLFTPVNLRASQSGASDQNLVYFNSNTLNLTCPASPLAVISSAASSSPLNSSGNILVDNYLDVTVTPQGASPNSTANVCTGGVPTPYQNCFTSTYQGVANSNLGADPDTYLPTWGVAPINISSQLVNGAQQVQIALADQGGVVASSTLYLNTNCTSGGVSAPATISGNPISSTNPPTSQLTQNFTFNPVTNAGINFQYDLSAAQTAGTLSIDPGGVTPSVGDSAIDPSVFQATWVPGTSFATSACLVHDGEMLSNGSAGCKVFTLTCTIGTGSNASGVNCPASTAPNEALHDIFDGPAFALNDIPTTVNGVPVTFHEGIGFLMASEPWTGGSCQFATGSGFENSTCPQNLLTTFTGPGSFDGHATTTHPNSTFISIAQVPEDLTTVTVAGMQPGNWVNTSNPLVTLSSQPPVLTNTITPLPGAANFVASPIQSITYGISAADSVPTPGTPITTDTVLTNSIGCPTPASPGSPAAAVFTPDQQTLSTLSDGQYLLHYLAKDCAGTQELKFVQDANQSWSTNFYTFAINVDTAPPAASTPTLSAAPPYYQGQPLSATFSCTDTLSGVVQCGGQSFPAGTLNTGSITVPVSTATAGANTFTVNAKDAAGNTASAYVNYTVTAGDGQIQLTLSPGTVTYPLGTNVVVTVAKINTHTPTGTVQIVDGATTTLTKLTLNGAGQAYYYLSSLSAGNHSLTAVYSGDKYNSGGTSVPVTLNVLPVPVVLATACWNTPYPYGANFQCNVNASSNAGAAKGVITYVYDGGAPVSLPLSGGAANLVLTKPPVGNHTLAISYPAQTNYAAAGPKTTNFVVTSAPVQIAFTPSTWYLTGGTLKLTASVQSWSAGPPNANGLVTFTKGTTVLGSAPVNASGVASISIPASSLPNGSDTLTATYSGGVNYGTGATSITIQVAH